MGNPLVMFLERFRVFRGGFGGRKDRQLQKLHFLYEMSGRCCQLQNVAHMRGTWIHEARVPKFKIFAAARRFLFGSEPAAPRRALRARLRPPPNLEHKGPGPSGPEHKDPDDPPTPPWVSRRVSQ